MAHVNKTISKQSIDKIRIIAKRYFKKAGPCHAWDHVERVVALATHIAKKEKADLEVVTIAAYLHDIGRMHEDKVKGKICHAQKGKQLASKILNDWDLEDVKKKNILHSIEAHRFRNNIVPKTIEAKALFDADKLDSIGALGIGRDFLFAGEIGAKLYNSSETDIRKTKQYSEEDTAFREYKIKLVHIKSKIITREGKRIARGRHKFMVDFFDRFKKEIQGIL